MTEPDVIDVPSIVKFGIGLTVVTAVAHIAMLLMFNGMDSRAAAMEPARAYPLAISQDERRPPEPRLQGGVQSEAGRLLPADQLTEHNAGPKEALRELRAEEDVILNGYSWVDRTEKIVRIPIADAMKMTLQQGLPARSQAAAPAAQATPEGQEKGK